MLSARSNALPAVVARVTGAAGVARFQTEQRMGLGICGGRRVGALDLADLASLRWTASCRVEARIGGYMAAPEQL